MREISFTEFHHVSGASYEPWEVILVSGLSSGLAYGTIEAISTLSIVEGLKLFAICSVPTAITSAMVIGGIGLIEMAREWDSSVTMSHC